MGQQPGLDEAFAGWRNGGDCADCIGFTQRQWKDDQHHQSRGGNEGADSCVDQG